MDKFIIKPYLSKSESNKEYYSKNTPYPIRLGELKPKLQEEAFEKNSSVHGRIIDILNNHFENKPKK